MGQDKGLVLYRGKRMVEHIVSVCEELTQEIIVSANNPEYGFLGYKLIEDNYKDTGPIGGIQAALSASETDDNIFCPCDMPGIEPKILIEILKEKNNSLAVVAADSTGKIYPVLGYYSKNVLPVIEKQISKSDFKMQHLLKELDAKIVVFPDEVLKNINYPEDLQ